MKKLLLIILLAGCTKYKMPKDEKEQVDVGIGCNCGIDSSYTYIGSEGEGNGIIIHFDVDGTLLFDTTLVNKN